MNYLDIFENGKFKTTNTPLAAYLKSEGFELLEIDFKDKNAFLIFNDDSQILKDAVKSYHTLKAIGNIPLYHEIYHDLVCKIKAQKT